MTVHDAQAEASALDAADPLADLRELFVGAQAPLVYFDGNSLGRPLRATAQNVSAFVEDAWGGRLIRGWDEEWLQLPYAIGDQIGAATLAAAAGQTIIGDSTTVLLYKAVRAAFDAAHAADPRRVELIIDRDNFPTDRYLAESIAAERGGRVRWIDVDLDAGVDAPRLQAAVGPETAAVLLSHVAYRSGYIADAAALTAIVHEAGGLIVWDLCHSVGAVPVEADAWGFDAAVGCTYKYLNGGPGAPAFLYVARRHQDEWRQPIPGWIGAADTFAMGPEYVPGPGIKKFISGTVPVTGILPLRDTLPLISRVGIAAIRAKSIALTEFVIRLSDAWLAPLGATVASPRDASRRGGHVTISHPAMRQVAAALWQQDVIPDYRDPGGLRIGVSPLSTSFAEVADGMAKVAVALGSERAPSGAAVRP